MMARGVHFLANGDVVEAGDLTANDQDWTPVTFGRPFDNTPVVITQIADDMSHMVPRVKWITNSVYLFNGMDVIQILPFLQTNVG